MFTILLWNDRTEQLEHRFSTRYGERITRERNVPLGHGIIGAVAATSPGFRAKVVGARPK